MFILNSYFKLINFSLFYIIISLINSFIIGICIIIILLLWFNVIPKILLPLTISKFSFNYFIKFCVSCILILWFFIIENVPINNLSTYFFILIIVITH